MLVVARFWISIVVPNLAACMLWFGLSTGSVECDGGPPLGLRGRGGVGQRGKATVPSALL